MKPSDQIKRYILGKISYLSEAGNRSFVQATLANLRRGIAQAPGAMPELWEVTVAGLPEVLQGRGYAPSDAERAVHAALTLFAVHQQGKEMQQVCMSKQGEYLGLVLRKWIISHSEREEALTRRFHTVATADSFDELVWHMRGLVQLLRTGGYPLDYGELGRDLFFFQKPDWRDVVRLKWGREFYRNVAAETKDEQATLPVSSTSTIQEGV